MRTLGPTIADAMGFNPFRKSRKTTLDVAIVVVFAVITLAFVAWGFFG